MQLPAVVFWNDENVILSSWLDVKERERVLSFNQFEGRDFTCEGIGMRRVSRVYSGLSSFGLYQKAFLEAHRETQHIGSLHTLNYLAENACSVVGNGSHFVFGWIYGLAEIGSTCDIGLAECVHRTIGLKSLFTS